MRHAAVHAEESPEFELSVVGVGDLGNGEIDI